MTSKTARLCSRNLISILLLPKRHRFFLLLSLTLFLPGCNLTEGIFGEKHDFSPLILNDDDKQINNLPKSREAVAQGAKLNKQQLEQLVEFDDIYWEDTGLNEKVKLQVILPTNIPDGFVISNLNIEKNPNFPFKYEIVYHNLTNNSCFYFMGALGVWGDAPLDQETVEVNSPLFGKVILDFTTFTRANHPEYIGIQGRRIKINWKELSSSSYDFASPVRSEGVKCDKGVTVQEAVQIVESLQYLNP